MTEMLDILKEDNSKYKITINDQKAKLLCETKVSERGNTLLRMTIKYDFPAKMIWKTIVNVQNKPKYDLNLEST